MKVLIIEDEEKLAKYLMMSLQDSGIIADFCLTGKEGQSYIEINNEGIDLVVLDRVLPDIDGVTLCKNIRKQNISTPVLMLTAKTMISDIVEGLDAGADDYLVKPFSLKELIARIKALSRRPKVSIASKIIVKDLTLEPATQKVTQDGKEVFLTLKEFRILEYLMTHQNIVINREVLLDKL